MGLFDFITNLLGGSSETHHHQNREPRKWEKPVSGEPDVSIRYRNAKGEEKTFEGWQSSMEQKKNHLNLLVAPEKKRIALNVDKILNPEVLQSVAKSH